MTTQGSPEDRRCLRCRFYRRQSSKRGNCIAWQAATKNFLDHFEAKFIREPDFIVNKSNCCDLFAKRETDG